MKRTMVFLTLFLLVTSVWAGTFRDDFEDGNLDGWRQEIPPQPILWRVIDGELECTQRKNVSAVLITGDVTWGDYTIEYDVKLLEDFGPGDVDILARYMDFKNHTLLFASGDFLGNPQAFMVRALPLVIIEKPFEALELREWHHLKLEVKKQQFIFWINGQIAIEYEEPSKAFGAGAVGIGLANYAARFDNLEISGPDVPDVTPPTWENVRPVHPQDKLATTWGKIKQHR